MLYSGAVVMGGAKEQKRAVGGMSTHTTSWLAWSLATLSVAMFVTRIPLYVVARGARVPTSWGANLTVGGSLLLLLFLSFPLVGALIASGRPRNPIG